METTETKEQRATARPITVGELRLGNLIQRGDGSVFAVDANDIVIINDWQGNIFNLPKPIKLNQEWVIKFGLEKRGPNEDGMTFGILNFTIVYAKSTDGEMAWFLDGYHNDCHIEYVHQLQNVFFSLRGKELQLKEILDNTL